MTEPSRHYDSPEDFPEEKPVRIVDFKGAEPRLLTADDIRRGLDFFPDDGPKFEWPCDRHQAHGKHVVESVEFRLKGTPIGKAEAYDCPGVPSHPATMAGGSWKRW